MRAYPAVLAGVLVGLGGLGGPAAAGCTGPDLTATREGGRVVVRGEGWHAGCPDTVSCSGLPGCQRCRVDDPARPYVGVAVELRQGDRVVPLGTVDARGERHAVALTVAAPPGPGTVVATAADGTRVTVPLR